MYDLKQAMRALCPEAAEVVKRCLHSKDEKVALIAAQIAFDRGFGRPEVHAGVDVNHKFAFAVVPEVLTREAWLETVAKPALEKRASEAPAGVAGLSTEAAPVLDLEAEEPPEPGSPPTPPVDPGKLN